MAILSPEVRSTSMPSKAEVETGVRVAVGEDWMWIFIRGRAFLYAAGHLCFVALGIACIQQVCLPTVQQSGFRTITLTQLAVNSQTLSVFKWILG